MLALRIALRNILRNRRKTITVGAIVAVCLCCILIGRAVILSSSSGLRDMYVDSFTADAVISANTGEILSVFGNIDPVLSEFSVTPVLKDAEEIADRLSTDRSVERVEPLVSTAARIQHGKFRGDRPVFGVSAGYFGMFPSLKIVEGAALREGERGIVITRSLADAAEKANGRRPVPGDVFKLSSGLGNSFAIREVPLAGISEYSAPDRTLDSITLVDRETARALSFVTIGAEGAISTGEGTDAASVDIEDLFGSETSGFAEADDEGLDVDEVEREIAGGNADTAANPDGAVHFLLVRLTAGASGKGWIRNAARGLRESGFDVRVADWRVAAGMGAVAVFALGIIFDAGFLVVGAGALAIIMNSLVISVLERAKEAGTMRALGASKGFVSRVFLAETAIVTTAFGAFGVLCAIALNAAFAARGIRVQNPLLVTLFGGTLLKPSIDPVLALQHVGLAFLIGIVASVYPICLLNKLTPSSALAVE